MTETTPRRRHGRARRVLLTLLVVVAVLLVSIGTAGYLAIRHFDRNIHSYDINAALGTDRPTKVAVTGPKQPINILVMGSDTRQGQGAGYGSEFTGARSDTTMLVHIAADRQRITVVSIPRDSWVTLPSCKESGTGATYPSHDDRFNAAFSIGGPACTVKTVEQLTGVYIDHYVVIDFNGFKRMVDALGGVPVCLDQAVNDPKSGLDLPAGTSLVHGWQALAFVRARYTLGDGSDIGRIGRQQAFLTSVINKARSTGTLLNPIKLYRFLDAATQSLTTDPGLGSVNKLRGLANDIRGIKPKDITFVTTPWLPRGDGATIVWDPAKTPAIWRALIDDKPYPPPAPKPTLLDGARLTVEPSSIYVEVLNGSGMPGAAQRAADQLTAQGYVVVNVGDAPTRDYRSSVVRYGTASAEPARTLAASVAGANRLVDPALGSTLQLVVGRDWSAVTPVVVPQQSSGNAGVRVANQSICATG